MISAEIADLVGRGALFAANHSGTDQRSGRKGRRKWIWTWGNTTGAQRATKETS